MSQEARLDGLRYLLTYSQINVENVTSAQLADFLADRHSSSSTAIWAEVNRESHDDGGDHYHAIVIFSGRFRGRMSSFDIAGYHPNIKSIRDGGRNLRQSREYIVKHGEWDYETRGELPESDTPNFGTTKRDPWHDIVGAPTADEFMALAMSKAPREYVTRHFDLLAYCQHRYNTPGIHVPKFPPESYVVPGEINDWLAEVFGEVSTSGSLFANLP